MKDKPYFEKLKDPRWQKKRLEILQRDEFSCQRCYDTESTLHVHHRWYNKGADPWEYENDALITLCETCHELETENMPSACSDLCKILKQKGFLSDEIHEIAEAFLHYEFPAALPLSSATIGFSLRPEIQQRMYQEWGEFCEKQRENNNQVTK